MFKFRYVNSEGQDLILGQDAPFFVTSREGFGAVENDVTTSKQYGMAGALFVGQQLATREISIKGEIVADTNDEMNERRSEMINIFNPDLAGTLFYTIENNNYMIDVVVDIAPDIDAVDNMGHQAFDIKLKALDPYFIDVTQYDRLISLSGIKKAWTFPTRIYDEFHFAELESGKLVNIVNNGAVAVGVEATMTISSVVTDIRIYKVETQEFFGFTGTFSAGTVLKLNTKRGKKSVTMTSPAGVTTNAMPLRMTGSSFIQMDKGDNWLQVQAEVGSTSVITNLSFNPLVLGV